MLTSVRPPASLPAHASTIVVGGGSAGAAVAGILAESYERIHRSNLVGMGVLPLQYLPGESAASHGLTGRETFSIGGIASGLKPRARLTVDVTREDGSTFQITAIARIDSPVEVRYYENGGILPTVLRRLIGTTGKAEA